MTGEANATDTTGALIGVLGGGQLGRMLGLAGIPLGFRFVFLDPSTEACAGQVGELVRAAFDDETAAHALGKRVDLATFDFENVPDSAAAALEEVCALFPGSNALAASQDRIVEKSLLESLGIAVPGFRAVGSRTELLEGLERLAYPAVLKTRRFGYDGKGQAVLRDQEDLERAWQALGDSPLILEAFVPFAAECSLVSVRSRNGDIRHWPLTQNVHDGGILALSRPGVFNPELQEQAEGIMRRLMEHLDYTGVLTIEFFLVDGNLLVNEFAPRVHNSGHWTIDGSVCSQFENHLRAISGLPLGETTMTVPALMFNWIGRMPDRQALLEVSGLHWHDYGKAARPGRKIGHATVTASDPEELQRRAHQVAALAGGNFPVLLRQLLGE